MKYDVNFLVIQLLLFFLAIGCGRQEDKIAETLLQSRSTVTIATPQLTPIVSPTPPIVISTAPFYLTVMMECGYYVSTDIINVDAKREVFRMPEVSFNHDYCTADLVSEATVSYVASVTTTQGRILDERRNREVHRLILEDKREVACDQPVADLYGLCTATWGKREWKLRDDFRSYSGTAASNCYARFVDRVLSFKASQLINITMRCREGQFSPLGKSI